MVEKIEVFTDGSCTSTSEGIVKGGIGGYFPDFPSWNFSKRLRGKLITNQRAELRACIDALVKIRKERKGKHFEVVLYTDSMYTLKIATEWGKLWKKAGWKRGKRKEAVSNLELVKRLVSLVDRTPAKFIHVRSHKSEPKDKASSAWKRWKGNKEADKLATSSWKKK